MTKNSKGLGGTGGSSVSTEAAATASAAEEMDVVTVLLLGDAHVGEGDIVDLDNGLLHVGG